MEQSEHVLPAGKVFSSGIIGWSLFFDFWHEQEKLLDDLNFLVDAGFRTNKSMAALEFIERELEQAKKLHKEAWEKALAECQQAGGNGVTVIPEDPPRLKK